MSSQPYSRLVEGEQFEIETVADDSNLVQVTLQIGEATQRRIDYVLVYETSEDDNEDDESKEDAERRADARTYFEKQLEKQGLNLQHKTKKDSDTERHFVLIHVPWEVLARRAELSKMKVPLRINNTVFESWFEFFLGSKLIAKFEGKNPLKIRDASIPETPDHFMGVFKRERLSEYLQHKDFNKDTFFSNIDRQHLLQQILNNTRYSADPSDVGLTKLVYNGAYQSCYPLHDGEHDLSNGETAVNLRQQLKRDWARFGRIFKSQPYHAIKDYFGHTIGLYFAWLGFYTAMLVPLAIFALIVFIYGIASSSSHIPVRDICSESNRDVWYMCPLCDRQCSYWNLAPDTCMYAKVTHFFDNDWTVALAFFASIWATLFLEFWKRRQATLAHKWHTSEFEEEEEQFRPEYLASLTEEEREPYKPDPKTGKIRPNKVKVKRFRRLSFVLSVISFMILLVIVAMIGVVVYRAAVFAVLSSSSNQKIENDARILTTITAAFINLVIINILQSVYNRLALFLTDWENPMTRTEYKDSFTRKMALFQFVNNYTSIFYIAFFKSEMIVGSPGRYRRVFGKYRLDGCSAQGCFLELAIQIATIMVGQQLFYNITELGIPYVKMLLKKRRSQDKQDGDRPQYELDHDLSPLERHFMFWEYLEIVLQYGFVTMFVAAFPLGPLFALLNVIVEIRVDAINFLCQYRRADAVRAEDIGAWYGVLETITKISVLVNGFILAFTSEFIPKLAYKMVFSKNENPSWSGTLEGYVNNSLAYIDLHTLYTWENGTQPVNPTKNLNFTRDYCRYKGYYQNYYPYKHSTEYWNILAARLAFVFVFQFTVYAITSFIAWAIPDVPEELVFKIKREKELEKEILWDEDNDNIE